MPCYNSLAADRHADDLAEDSRIDTETHIEVEILIDDFACGEECDAIQFDTVLDNTLTDPRTEQLIRQAWETNDYTKLGPALRDELVRHATEQARSAVPDIRKAVKRRRAAAPRPRKIPARGTP